MSPSPSTGKHTQAPQRALLGLLPLLEPLLLPLLWHPSCDVPATAVSSWPLWFLFQLAGLGKLSLSSFHILWRGEETKTKKKKRMKNQSKRKKNTHLAMPGDLKCPYKHQTFCSVSVRAGRTGDGKKGERKKFLHWKFTLKKPGKVGLSQAAVPVWAVLITLCSSGSFQVIALKIPYLQRLKIISSFLFIDLPLYFYDLPFPNIFQGFINNNLPFFLPT